MTGQHQNDPEQKLVKVAKQSKKWMSEWKEIAHGEEKSKSAEDSVGGSLDRELRAITTESGWYRLDFGKDDFLLIPTTKSRRKASSGNKSQHVQAINKPSHVLRVHKNQKLVQEIPLPIFSEKDGIAVTSSRVGVVLFFEANTSLSVVPVPHENNHVSEDYQWRVAFHGYLDKSKCNSPPSNGTLAWGATNFNMKRCFVCSLCGKSLFDVSSVQQHQQIRHADELQERAGATTSKGDDEDEIWKRPLHCLYQDDAMVVIDKPQGMAVMGADRTLQRSGLLMPFKGTRIPDWPSTGAESSSQQDRKDSEESGAQDSILGKPRPVHRLDGVTGGVLVIAKTKRSERTFHELFSNRQCHKTYRAIVYGKLNDPGVCELALSDKPCKTEYRPLRYGRSVISTDEWLTVVELSPVTGRYHQLRRHLQFLKHPIVGDPRYGGGPFKLDGKEPETPQHLKRLCLWAIKIEFKHPVTNKAMAVELPREPEWIELVMTEEAKRWELKSND